MQRRTLKSHSISRQPAQPPGEVVLREWEENQWAVHFYNSEAGGYCHGHYFSSLEEAEVDFAKQVKRWSGEVTI